MGRPIDADALKELFREVIGRIAIKPEMNGNLEHMIRASAMVIQMIDDAPTVQPVQRWIPCSERLPLPQTLVWTTDKHGIVSVCKLSYKSGGWYDKDEGWVYMHDSVIAWMPYDEPEPYQGVER